MSATLASMDLTASQGHILAFIAHSPQPPCPRDMEEAFQLSHPTVSGILSRLEKKGFIRCDPDPSDRRCKRVFLDAKGKECLARMDATIAGNERRMVQNFTEEERRNLSVRKKPGKDAKTVVSGPHSSSVTFGDSFSPGEALGAPAPVQLHAKLQFETSCIAKCAML